MHQSTSKKTLKCQIGSTCPIFCILNEDPIWAKEILYATFHQDHSIFANIIPRITLVVHESDTFDVEMFSSAHSERKLISRVAPYNQMTNQAAGYKILELHSNGSIIETSRRSYINQTFCIFVEAQYSFHPYT